MFAVLMLCPVAASQAQLAWQPAMHAATSHAGHGKHEGHGKKAVSGHRGPKRFQLTGQLESTVDISLIRPDLTTVEMPNNGDNVTVRPSGMGNYHELVARQSAAGREDVAVRYLYMNGKTSGNSPSDLLAQPLSRLQLIPAPLPREHRRYLTRKPYQFEVRFDGELMPEQPVTLRTQGGSQQDLLADKRGILTVVFPEDFEEIHKGRRKNRPGDWQLSTYIRMDDVLYRTSLSAPYSPSPANWQSYSLGALVAALGFGVGLVANRRVPEQSRRKKR